ncbi:hypothetical protein ACFPT7_02105 [Acidicapsa dinghuensis]|uniref:Uncharacterized protein n=1 Tax=Acidicapsa dinghuensis TaxID=2218256 RepID=A0ABW1E9S5_9BACT|nr:hypothetical protein [Acidicapsa dinghuensis]
MAKLFEGVDKGRMTAEYLVAEIFSRTQRVVDSDVRVLTERQFAALRGLILSEEPKGTVLRGDGGSMVWMPPGPLKYVLTEYRASGRRSLTRMKTAHTGGEKEPMLWES